MTYSGAEVARTTREKIGQALASLQADPNITPEVLNVVQNLAKAVGALFEAERASSEPDGRASTRSALGALSQTLALLQDIRGQQAGVKPATAVIAEAIGLLFPLTTASNPPSAGSQAGAPAQPYGPGGAGGAGQPAARGGFGGAQHPGYDPNAVTLRDAPRPAASAPASPPASSPAQPSFQPAPQGPQPAAPHHPAGQRSAPAAAPGGYPPPAGSSPAWSDPARAPTVGSAPGAGAIGSAPTTPSYRDAGARADVEANLGVTTESNVFVGFSGEVREGGVFVATYNIHPVGTRVRMLITLPGGLSTEVDGHVRFVRDPMDMASDAQPGMGVGFDGLSPHARELLLRFIRNRPPMFYDV